MLGTTEIQYCPRVDTTDLQQVLVDLFCARAPGLQIMRIDRSESQYRSSFPLEELCVWMSDGGSFELIFKDVNPQSLSPELRCAKPAFLDNPLRELEVYRSVLDPAELGTAICYGTVINPASGRYWLFLENVSGLELYQHGDVDVWKGAARWLAQFHERFSLCDSRLASIDSQLIRYDADYYELWTQRFCAICDSQSTSAQLTGRVRIRQLADAHARAIPQLLELPASLIHGEFYASNLIVRNVSGSPRLCPIDWERASLGPGMIDVAALTSGRWSEQQKQDLAFAYRDAVPRKSKAGEYYAESESFLRAFYLCRLHLAIQWLGWSVDWSPPPEHRQDWFAEAEFVSERLQFLH